MKKLLIGTDNFLPRWDGISRFLNEILPDLSQYYDITVLAPKFKGSLDEEMFGKVRVIRFPTFKFHVGDFPPARPALKRIHKYVIESDIVFTQSIGPISGATLYLASKSRKKVISYIHSLEWDLIAKTISLKSPFKKSAHGITRLIAKFLYNRATLILVPSLEVAEILNWQKIRVKKKVVHLATDTQKFKPPEDRAEAKKKIGIDPKYTVIGYVGRLAREKSLPTLYRAFTRLQKKRKDIKLLIVGEGIPELHELFENKEDIIAVGASSDVQTYYRAMDIYVLPSLTETSSLTTMEAMACGCAVISTPVGYVKDYVIEEYNGMFFPQEQEYILSKKIEKLLEDKKLMKKISENARKTIVAEYSWKKTIDEIKNSLDEVLKSD